MLSLGWWSCNRAFGSHDNQRVHFCRLDATTNRLSHTGRPVRIVSMCLPHSLSGCEVQCSAVQGFMIRRHLLNGFKMARMLRAGSLPATSKLRPGR